MKRILPLLSVLLASSPAARAAPPAPGSVPAPPDDGPVVVETDTPQPLPLGASSNRVIPAGGLARFEHRAEGPGVLKVAVGGPESLALQVCTPGKIAAVGGWSNQGLEGDWSERVAVPVFEPGVYEVMVQLDGDPLHGGAYHLAAAFEPGEPAPTEQLTEAAIERARAVAEAAPLRPDADATGRVAAGEGPGHVRVYTLEAAPGLYAVSSASAADVELAATSSTLGAWASAWQVPDLGEYAEADSDADFFGEPGREALLVDLPEGGRAWVAVTSPVGEAAAFTLRLRPLDEPEAPGPPGTPRTPEPDPAAGG